MNVKDTLAGLGGLLIMGVFLVVDLAIAGVFIFGAAWASTKLLPWFSVLTWIVFGLVVFILLPLAIPRATRAASQVWRCSSRPTYSVPHCGWRVSCLRWGFGVWARSSSDSSLRELGFVPIAMLATLLKGMWSPLIELV